MTTPVRVYRAGAECAVLARLRWGGRGGRSWLVATGHTNAEIGDLGLSLNTVKAYLHNVMHKLDAHNRAQAITNAHTHGLL